MGSSFISVALTDLHDDPVGIDEPHDAPSWDEIVEAQRSQRDRDRITDSHEKGVQIVGLKGNMPDSSRILRPVSHGLMDRAVGGMEKLEVGIPLGEERRSAPRRAALFWHARSQAIYCRSPPSLADLGS